MQIFWEKILTQDKFIAGCSKCIDGKIKVAKEPIGWDVKICDCLYQKEHLQAVSALLEKSNLPKGLIRKNPIKLFTEDTITYALLEQLVSILFESGDSWLYLFGNPGTGKTFISMVIAQLFLEQEKKVYFSTVTDLLDMLRPSDTYDPKEWFKKIKEVDLLILDDIGQEKSSQWVRERLYMLINYRYNECLPTVFTSNKQIEELKTQISEAVYSRVKSNCLFLDLTEQDKRLKQK